MSAGESTPFRRRVDDATAAGSVGSIVSSLGLLYLGAAPLLALAAGFTFGIVCAIAMWRCSRD